VIRIGIDVGGTNTDAVIMDGERVVASFKAPTSPDVMTGVSESLNGALTQSGVPAQAIDVVMLGTTHFTTRWCNAAAWRFFLCRSGSGRPQRERNERRDVRAPTSHMLAPACIFMAARNCRVVSGRTV
jgi:hypothetical protein